jgi:DNA-binding LytR/AlgR family response regulator
MARILLAETNHSVRRLLELRIESLGHEPVVWDGGDVAATTVDVAIVEPADRASLSLARTLRRADPDLPIVVSSVRGRTLESAWLRPAAHLVKPYAASRLERALDDALALSLPLAWAS